MRRYLCLPSRFHHTASAAAFYNPQKYHPEKEEQKGIKRRTKVCEMFQNNVVSGAYRDVGIQRLSVFLQILLSDVQHVYVRAGHHDADEGSVLGPSSLLTNHSV